MLDAEKTTLPFGKISKLENCVSSSQSKARFLNKIEKLKQRIIRCLENVKNDRGDYLKRYGNLYEKICDLDNIKKAHKMARKDKAYYQEVQMVDKIPSYYCK